MALVVLGAATGLGGVMAAAVPIGLGFGSAQPALQAAMLRIVPRERFGIANASFFTAFDLGIALGQRCWAGWPTGWGTGPSLWRVPCRWRFLWRCLWCLCARCCDGRGGGGVGPSFVATMSGVWRRMPAWAAVS